MEFEMNLEQTLNEITGKMYGKISVPAPMHSCTPEYCS